MWPHGVLQSQLSHPEVEDLGIPFVQVLDEPGADVPEAFAEALSRGFARFVRFLGAGRLDAKAIGEPRLRRSVSKPG